MDVIPSSVLQFDTTKNIIVRSIRVPQPVVIRRTNNNVGTGRPVPQGKGRTSNAVTEIVTSASVNISDRSTMPRMRTVYTAYPKSSVTITETDFSNEVTIFQIHLLRQQRRRYLMAYAFLKFLTAGNL